MRKRWEKLTEHINKKGLDAMLVTSMINARYFSGFTGDNVTLLITGEKRILFTDFRYTIQAKIQSENFFDVREVQKSREIEALADEIKALGLKRVGFEEQTVSVGRFEEWKCFPCEFVPASEMLAEIRLIKSADEIENIVKAQNISDDAFLDILGRMKPGMTEKEVAVELEYRIKNGGADDIAFDIIVASGENGALCHAVPGLRKLAYGDLVVMDFGSKLNGYCSDMTRTVAIGEPSKKLCEIYRIVYEAQSIALDALKPGISCKALDAAARDYIASFGYGECFGHSLGHGFGLEVHEGPAASSRSEEVLKPGMTVTVEPGIYIEGLGGVRIEDCCIVTEDGHINPVTASKELLIIE
ncbi:MAG: putative peptidase [Firmicutes bacterium ADurb.Bin182]|nr:MAG: putative peptidase [Firmicutes bacterium ADurb.Bin182]